MIKGLVAKAEIVIKAPASKVWEALTKPELVKEYLFGTEISTDWKVGGPVTYKGEWQGKPYEDKGTVLEFEPKKKIVTTYWSSMSGKEDKPENYNTVTQELSESGGGTKLTITQDNNLSEESRAHSEKNWNTVLQKMKEILEK